MSVCTWRFRVVVRYGCGLGDGLAAAGPGFRVAFALVFELADGPVVGDLIPVVGQSAGGVDATEPVRVRRQPVDDREDERLGDPVDEVPDLGVVTFGRRRGRQRQLGADGREMVHHGHGFGRSSRLIVFPVLPAGALPACGELSRRERGVIVFQCINSVLPNKLMPNY